MVRCADFYEKWKKDPNWCEKSPKAVEQIDHYLALVEEIADKNVDPIAIYKQFPEGATREVYNLKGDQRAEIVTNVAGKIKRGEKVSPLDIKTWLGIESKPTPKSDETKRTIVPNVTPDVEVKAQPAPVVPIPVPAPVLAPAKMVAAPIVSTDPDKQKRSEQHWYAEQFLDRVSSATKTMVVDIMRDNPTWKPADLLFYAITALSESKKKR